MKYCNKCNVSVDDPINRCPLCYAHLSQQDNKTELQTYPSLLKIAERYNLLYRILIMLSLTISVVCITINYFATPDILWSLLVVGNIGYMWIAIGTAVREKSKLGFNILIQAISLSALMVLIDRFSGNSNWALNYVVPFLFITATLSITVIIIVRRMDSRSFILYLILTALIGFLPIVFVGAGLITVRWPSIVSALYSGLSLISLFIFADRVTIQELKKRFHL